MFINIKNETSKNLRHIKSSSIVIMQIIDMQEWNNRSVVKKWKHGGASHIIEAETKNNVITDDRVSSNGVPAYSFDSEIVDIHYGTESECLDRLENIQSSLKWLKAESLSNVVPHGLYINPSNIMYLNICERLNSHQRKPNTHTLECVLDHQYISDIDDFIPNNFRLDRLPNLEKSISQIIETPKSITMFLMHIREKLESITEYKKVTLFTGSESDCQKKLEETIAFLEKFD